MSLFGETSEKKIRIIKTCVLYASFFALGMVMAIPGPTLIDIQHKVNTTPKVTSYLLFGRAFGSVVGALGSALVFDRFNRQLSYALAVLIMGIGTVGFPGWTLVTPMGVFIGLAGVGIGAILGAGNVWCLDLWGDSSQPFLQALYFFYGTGMFLAPLISVPFLAPHDEASGNGTNISFVNATETPLTTHLLEPTQATPYPDDGLYVIIPYLMVGSFSILVAIAITVVSIIFPKDSSREALMDEELIVASKEKRPPKLVRTHKMYLIVLAFSFLLIYCGMETIFSLQLTTYVENSDLGLDKKIGGYMTSVFWGSFVLTRGLSVLCSIKLTPRVILICSVIFLNLSSILLASGGDTKVVLLWVGASTTGIGMSAIMPSLYNWVETHVAITNRIASFFNLAGAIGSAIFPVIVGQYIEYTPIILFYIMVGGSVTILVLYAVILIFIGRVMKLRSAFKIDLDMKDPFSWNSNDPDK